MASVAIDQARHMITIYKHEVPLDPGPFTRWVPMGAAVLSVQLQDGAARMWLQCNSDAELEPRRFFNAFTGHSLPSDLVEPGASRFIGTYQLGGLVYHLYEYAPMQALSP